MNWSSFLQRLETLDWSSDTEETFRQAAAILQSMASSPGGLLERARAIVEDPEQLARYKAIVNFPSKIMDKFTLYVDPRNDFAVRLHRMKNRAGNAGKVPQVHSHDWSFASVILKGAYHESSYRIYSIDTDQSSAELRHVEDRTLTAGSINIGMSSTAHRTWNDGEEDCWTLFVRGQIQGGGFKVYDLEQGSFFYNPDKAPKPLTDEAYAEALLQIAAL